MVALTNSDNDLITNRVGEIVPSYMTNKVVKQLLSGAHHVQVIGTGARVVTAEVQAEPAGRELLNKAESTGEPLRLDTRTKYYIGIRQKSKHNFNNSPGKGCDFDSLKRHKPEG